MLCRLLLYRNFASQAGFTVRICVQVDCLKKKPDKLNNAGSAAKTYKALSKNPV
jgi:hypothetical protein